jgi:hypothetical protein
VVVGVSGSTPASLHSRSELAGVTALRVRARLSQVDDGTPAGLHGRGEMPTSSASCPDIVTVMLAAGQLEPGMLDSV